MSTGPTTPVVNLGTLSAAVAEPYRNWVVDEVNASCLRLAVMTGAYPWHRHETSDELFVVLEGELTIDFADGRSVTLRPLDVLRVPAGVVHRTRAAGRTVNFTVEHTHADTVFVDGP